MNACPPGCRCRAVSPKAAARGLATPRFAGTPIQNDLSEFHAVFDVACPGLLGDANEFRRKVGGWLALGWVGGEAAAYEARGQQLRSYPVTCGHPR